MLTKSILLSGDQLNAERIRELTGGMPCSAIIKNREDENMYQKKLCICGSLVVVVDTGEIVHLEKVEHIRLDGPAL